MIINTIDEHLLQQENRVRERHYPSDVTKCLRQLFYNWTGEEKSNPIEAGALWKMKAGDALHEMIIDIMQESGYDIISEVAGKQSIDGLRHVLSYRIDGLFAKGIDTIGIEIKTSFGRGIKEIQKTQQPKDNDIAQVVMYMELADIKEYHLVYFGRDNAYRTEFLFQMKDDGIYYNGKKSSITFDGLIQRLVILEKHIKDNEIPSREYKVAIKNGEIKEKFQKNKVEYKSDWQCRYCQWRDRCWKQYVELSKQTGQSFHGKELC